MAKVSKGNGGRDAVCGLLLSAEADVAPRVFELAAYVDGGRL